MPLSDLTEAETPVTYGVVKPGDEDTEGVLFIRGGDIAGGRILTGQLRTISKEISRQYKRTLLRGGEIVMSLVGNPGQVAIVPESLRGANIARQAALIRLRPDVDTRFVMYFLGSRVGQEALGAHSRGSVQQVINLRDLKTVGIPTPSLPEQRAIAHILGTLDDKIELNLRMNETLEAMARALFKSWFVDFDPVRAKDQGRDPGLPGAIADMFPAAFEDSELGKIPTSWRIRPVGEHMLNFDSKRIPLSGAERAKRYGPYPYHGAAGVMDQIDDYLFDGIYLLVGEDGSVIRDNGIAVTQYAWGKFWVNNHAHVLQGSGPVSTEHLYLYFQFETVAPYVTGAVQPKLSQGRMNTMPFVFAGETICQAFAEAIGPWFAKYRANVEANKTLAGLRDALLPKLLSGELRVKEMERQLEAAL
jgi:type I restriction enzyme S subunit